MSKKGKCYLFLQGMNLSTSQHPSHHQEFDSLSLTDSFSTITSRVSISIQIKTQVTLTWVCDGGEPVGVGDWWSCLYIRTWKICASICTFIVHIRIQIYIYIYAFDMKLYDRHMTQTCSFLLWGNIAVSFKDLTWDSCHPAERDTKSQSKCWNCWLFRNQYSLIYDMSFWLKTR